MFALVQWLDGQLKDTHTVVPAPWLRDFNLELFKKKENEFYVMELRHEGKMPVEGWPSYKVKLLDAHGNRKKLETQARELDRSEDLIPDTDNSDAEMKDTVNVEYIFDGEHIKADLEELCALRSKLHNLEEEHKKLKEENLELHRRVSDEIPELHRCFLSMKDDSKVELYQGSGIFVDDHAMKLAISKTKPRSFICTLLENLFPMNDLLNSNYKGGLPRKMGKSGERTIIDRKTALCPKKLDAIYKATLKKFPSITKGKFGQIINCKIACLRYISRKNAGKYIKNE